MSDLTALVLAAGQSRRMQSPLSKILHPVAGWPLLHYPVAAALAAGASQVVESGSSMLDLPTDMSGKPTKKSPDSEMRDHYDFSVGVRGKYASRYAEGTNVVVLDPDVAAKIKSAEEVNRILREHLASHPKTDAV